MHNRRRLDELDRFANVVPNRPSLDKPVVWWRWQFGKRTVRIRTSRPVDDDRGSGRVLWTGLGVTRLKPARKKTESPTSLAPVSASSKTFVTGQRTRDRVRHTTTIVLNPVELEEFMRCLWARSRTAGGTFAVYTRVFVQHDARVFDTPVYDTTAEQMARVHRGGGGLPCGLRLAPELFFPSSPPPFVSSPTRLYPADCSVTNKRTDARHSAAAIKRGRCRRRDHIAQRFFFFFVLVCFPCACFPLPSLIYCAKSHYRVCRAGGGGDSSTVWYTGGRTRARIPPIDYADDGFNDETVSPKRNGV